MSILSRLGAKKFKYNLDVLIHYVAYDCPDGNEFKVIVKRGRRKKEETHTCAVRGGRIAFDSNIHFQITMYGRGGKFSKKDVACRLASVQPFRVKKDGKAVVKVAHLALTGVDIKRQVFPLKGSSDSAATICLSISLSKSEEIAPIPRTVSECQDIPKNFVDFCTGSPPKADPPLNRAGPLRISTGPLGMFDISEGEEDQSPELKPIPEPVVNRSDGNRGSRTNIADDESRENIKQFQVPEAYTEFHQTIIDNVKPADSFADFRDTLPASRMDAVAANAHSKESQIQQAEAKAGITKSRRSVCSTCKVF